MYEISSDPARQLLIVRVSGFWTHEIMATYRAEVGQQASALRQAGGCKRILIDMSHYPIQSGDIADGHTAALRFARETLGARCHRNDKCLIQAASDPRCNVVGPSALQR
ncbi:MAG: hypothetical protein EOP64_06070 [Sphingomonas sp.]|nr:MAG: hypothetical protein EOP64_06070 [Sphingomonas sp.]